MYSYARMQGKAVSWSFGWNKLQYRMSDDVRPEAIPSLNHSAIIFFLFIYHIGSSKGRRRDQFSQERQQSCHALRVSLGCRVGFCSGILLTGWNTRVP